MSTDFLDTLEPFETGTLHSMLQPGGVVTQPHWPTDAAPSSIHVIRIGGAGMSAVARLALDAGLTVTGSESQDGQFLQPLRDRGATITVGFDADNLTADTDLVVVSTAVRADNPEVLAAREAGIPVIHRAAALAGLLGTRRQIAVAGTHGKTTTTSMAVMALQAAGEDPAWAIGAAVPQLGANAGFGSTDTAVIEADESDGSLVAFSPAAAVITNFEADHLDFHGTEENLRAIVSAFIARLHDGAPLIACADDPGALSLAVSARGSGHRVLTYGEHQDADWRILEDLTTPAGAAVRLSRPTGADVELRLAVPGRHNILNATGALVAAAELGFEPEQVLAGLAEFTGAARRFQRTATIGSIDVIDDYAHHPREVAATIDAARDLAGDRPVIAVFQPHLFSRTKTFTREFADALAGADQQVLLPIYPAREDFDPSIRSEDVAALVPGGAARVVEKGELPAAVADLVGGTGGAVVLMMGAGDVVEESAAVADALRAVGRDSSDSTDSAGQADGR
ncbi:UDP-N-acetylmuramate--L-alanine ligase [Helcobacillus massiliensis]|uniref:UDP-N-acetylmuramate--L-alanine ligase n=1 Tax=Helcobacillus massiliensis TaxID=521392 RepID=UPI0021A38B54|nr:UDP-N-acetylmuramate--L-alanine ligase [Helcobacillus massiliensis]MCT1557832.1 UDP-N-acetylmuramate--L-alanine ligase [Helcobacillus massiliensis]MCT2036672.1 UDP-N-acetylmuramate--L-alanine ligase [Helcobacillus massiliensis]MCT2332143.1 UDP-N-acetylmuramate--L-alanine ligase [Helcobacillus massiliensis]